MVSMSDALYRMDVGDIMDAIELLVIRNANDRMRHDLEDSQRQAQERLDMLMGANRA